MGQIRHLRKRYLVGCILLTGLAVTGGVSIGATSTATMEALEVQALPPGTKAPEFMLKDLTGKMVGLKDFRGKVVLLNFWATWCIPCQWEMGEMEKLYQAFKATGFVVLAVSLDAEGVRVVEPFARQRKLTYPILLDTEGQAALKYRILGPPTTFLLNAQGEAIGTVLGPRPWAGDDAKALIRDLLARKKGER